LCILGALTILAINFCPIWTVILFNSKLCSG